MKHNAMRKLIALFMAVAMIASMCSSAFATAMDTQAIDPFDFSDLDGKILVSEPAEEAVLVDEEGEETLEEAPAEAVSVNEPQAYSEKTEGSEAEAAPEAAEKQEDSAVIPAEAENDIETLSPNQTLENATYYLSASDGKLYVRNTDGSVPYTGTLPAGSSYVNESNNATVTLAADTVYVDGEVYTGYYLDSADKMYSVKNGTATLVSGTLTSGKQYYSYNEGKYVTLAANTVYVQGEVYTGYYMNSADKMYSVKSGAATLLSGTLTSGKEYYSYNEGKYVTLAANTVYVQGEVYTGYYMNSADKMYSVKSGTAALVSGTLTSGKQYYSYNEGKYVTLAANTVYVQGAVYTGYYTNSADKMYSVKSGTATLLSGTLTSGKQYYSYNQRKYVTLSANTVYVQGEVYTGYYMNSADKMYSVKSGTATLLSGTLASGKQYYSYNQGKYVTLAANTVYVQGGVYTGYYMNSSDKMYSVKSGTATLLSGTLASGKQYYSYNQGKYVTLAANTVYVKGEVYTGYYMNSANKMYTVKDGTPTLYSGTLASGTSYYSYNDGKTLTLADDTTYIDGVAGGWKFSDDKAYYYVGGKKVTGWQYVARNGSTYKYYFDKNDGHLVTNLYAYFGSAYKSKKCRISVNLSTFNGTIFGYDDDGKPTVPYYSFICSPAKNDGTPTGDYALSGNVRKEWLEIVSENGTPYYYCWATLISGSGCYFHSEVYKENGNLNSFQASSYNALGTNQSAGCVRLQYYVAKLIYDIKGNLMDTSVPVTIKKASVYGPFGLVKLSSTTGKISSSAKTDPTAASGYTGYIKQTGL